MGNTGYPVGCHHSSYIFLGIVKKHDHLPKVNNDSRMREMFFSGEYKYIQVYSTTKNLHIFVGIPLVNEIKSRDFYMLSYWLFVSGMK